MNEEDLMVRGITTRKTWQPIDGKADFSSLFRSRTQRWVARQNAARVFPSYRYEVLREGNRWVAVAFQNEAIGPVTE